MRTPLTAALLLLCALPARGQDFDRVVRAHTDTVPFAGVVLVGRGDRAVYTRPLGFADYERRVPTRADTRYQLGSISKWVCTLAVLRLQEEGRLDVRAPLSRALPAFRADNAARLTLHHLLTHTSGVPNEVIPAVSRSPAVLAEPLSPGEAIRRFASADLAWEPGSRWDYSHSNWILVRGAIEGATGLPVREAVRRLVVDPLRLRGTGVVVGDFARLPRAAVPYRALRPAPVRRDMPPLPDFVGCMAGSYGTAPDVLRLMHAAYTGRLLRPATRAAMNAVYVPEQGYGYGGRTHTLRVDGAARRLAWQSGSNGSFRSVAYRDLADGTTVVILSNTAPDAGWLSRFAEALLREAYTAG